ncbi:hypothetical protein [Gemmatimonas sp.]|uniref:hypothetical protein n=1 Tax=Gemmatimonas sp. TaxID=1962908 RepID=UPI00286E63E7|nr:hypothetical protein [Gemmatimonas sp.]
MGRRFTVMGFTEAELGFALAAFFVAVGAGYLQEKNALEVHTVDVVAENDSLRKKLDSLEARLQQLNSIEARLAKRSNLIPPCSEKGESEAPVADVKILDANRYELNGTELVFESVLLQLEPQMARSKSLGCRYSVQVVAMPGVDAPQFSRATGRLRRHFYVRER